jgi:hypothetical protein
MKMTFGNPEAEWTSFNAPAIQAKGDMIQMSSSQRTECQRLNLVFGRCLHLIVAAAILSGCTIIKSASREKGVDPSAIQPGVSRTDAEAVLGESIRQWTSETGIRYRLYRYDDGHRPDLGMAGVFIFLNAITLGLHEVFAVVTPAGQSITVSTDRRTFVPVIVSYNEADIILGVFDEFAVLPTDGRSGPREWSQ